MNVVRFKRSDPEIKGGATGATEQPDPPPRPLDLPGPRIWLATDLADFLRVKIGWIYKRTHKAASDPIPRCPGVGDLRFDTRSPAFQQWLARQLEEASRD
jgi:hypothetical protein